MIPYIIAGAIGYGIAKLLEEGEKPKYNDGGGVTPLKYKIILGSEEVEYDNLDDLIDDFEDKYNLSEKKKSEIVYGNDLIKEKGKTTIGFN